MSQQLDTVLKLIDQANSEDPNMEQDLNGQNQPKELLYGQRMSKCLSVFKPNASEPLQISARAQHIERWRSPRSDYEPNRVGYLKWRKELGLFHAERAGQLMTEAGYDKDTIARTKFITQKRAIKRDEDSQTLEDVICLVFLTYYIDSFAPKHSEAKVIDIIQKTWAKMSEDGHAAALKIDYTPSIKETILKALSV